MSGGATTDGVAAPSTGPARIVDDFADVAGWTSVASGQAKLDVSADRGPRGAALRVDFDFRGGAGFVVASKRFAVFPLPDAYAFTVDVRGEAPANALEFKLVDPGGQNVWRYRADGFRFPAEWRSLRIPSSQIEFAWGPAGGGPMREVGAVELAIVAPPGGKGTVWIANLRLEDRSVHATPTVRASSALPGHEPERALDRRPETSWRSDPSDEPQWFLVDFGVTREYGGLIVRWDPVTAPRPFTVECADDGAAWRLLYSAGRSRVARSYLYLPRGSSRWLRLRLGHGVDGNGIGIAEIGIESYEFSRSLDAFFQNVAAHARRGLFPRYLCGEQAYWTPVASARGGAAAALLNEDGLLEPDRGSFSIEPFLYVGETLVTWADVCATQELEAGFLPIPTAVWRGHGIVLRTTAFATGDAADAVLYVRYRIENPGAESRQVRFFIALRPFQVTPPWQRFEDLGGVARITTLEQAAGAVTVNRRKAVIPLTAADGFGAAGFDEGAVTEYIVRGTLPPEAVASDGFGHASGALRYDLDVATGAACDRYLAIPFGAVDAGRSPSPAALDGAAQFALAVREWSAKLGRVELRLPASARAFGDTFRTAAAHILVNRDGPALQPGPRRYARSWIRDGATMAAALLRVGCGDEVREYLRWYAARQAPDGTVPCCVDRKGPDWLPEYDSQGELIHAVMDCFRFTRDRAFVAESWPAVVRSVDRIEALRSSRLTAEYRGGEKRTCYGLLPESVSHEGYLAHPVHAYWDDFWALRGLQDAAAMAEVVEDGAQAARLAAFRDSFRETLRASIVATMADRRVDYVPASVEWADIDPAATANAIALLDESDVLPAPAVERTFDEYLADFRKRRTGEIDWTKYSPYEIRIVGALVRLGRRDDAFELARFFVADRRPPAWNQWPEIAWRDPRSPAHLGDLPHAWIGAEFMLAFRSMLAFEREADDALVVAAGIPTEWLDADGGVAVDGLPTWYGTLGFAIRREGDGVAVDLALTGEVRRPAGGIVVRPPGGAGEVTVRDLPAHIRLFR